MKFKIEPIQSVVFKSTYRIKNRKIRELNLYRVLYLNQLIEVVENKDAVIEPIQSVVFK